MKYQHLVSLVLAAALLLTGCGGTQSSPSAAADQSSDSSRSTPGAAAQAAQTDRITDQYTLEKNVSGVWGEDAVQYISVHVPKLECDSPDAAYINDELNAIYAADFGSSRTARRPGSRAASTRRSVWAGMPTGTAIASVLWCAAATAAPPRGVTAAGASILPPAGSSPWPRCCSG